MHRIANFHKNTIHSFLEMVGALGLCNPSDLKPEHIMRRTKVDEVKTFNDIYEYLAPGQLLTANIPQSYQRYWAQATAERF